MSDVNLNFHQSQSEVLVFTLSFSTYTWNLPQIRVKHVNVTIYKEACLWGRNHFCLQQLCVPFLDVLFVYLLVCIDALCPSQLIWV